MTDELKSALKTLGPKRSIGPKGVSLAPKKRELTVEQQNERHEKDLKQRREQTAKMLKDKPPGVKFYCITNRDDEDWYRLDAMPTEEKMESRKAIVWTGGMIGAAASHFGSFVLTGIHRGGKVIEFEYVYEHLDDPIKTKLYNPWF